jgi:pimeloyl-ACP methyl ester carboxylesterase
MSEPARAPVAPVERPTNRFTRTARTVRGTGGTALRAARTLLSPTGLRGIAVEAAWTTAHAATYPLGLLTRGRLDDSTSTTYAVGHLPPVQRGLLVGDVEAAGTPILLVHGMVDNRSVFTLLRRGLRRRGFGRVHTLNYSLLTSDIRRAARDLADEVEALADETGYERIHVVGHSMGGLIARYYVQRLGGDERVHTLVTLGTPHSGTLPARLLPTPLCRQLRPDSDLVAELAEPSAGCRTRFVAYWSDLDHMILPQGNARLTHPDLTARNELVRGVGHLSLPIDSRVVHGICTQLAQLDPDGSTATAGVAPLHPRRP